MERFQFKVYLYLIAIAALIHPSTCQDSVSGEVYGVVSLRPSPSAEAPVVTVTLNQAQGSVSVLLLLYDSTTQAPTLDDSLTIDEDVLVTCQIISLYEEGDTQVTFLEEVIPSFAENGTVTFKIVDQGRQVEIQCRGETSPTSTGTTSYFSLDTSAGPTGFVVVKKSPVVSFCEPIIVVPYSPNIDSSTVTLELSEPVSEFPVTVSCDIIGVLNANDSLWLVFEDKTVQPGASSVTVSYSIRQLGDIVQVACTAQSEEGIQYLANSSTGEPAIFSLDSGSASLVPETSYIQARQISVFLVLGSPLTADEGDITFACYADAVTSFDQGAEMASNPTCMTPTSEYVRPTPAPTTPRTPTPAVVTTVNTTDAQVNATSSAPTTTPTPTPAVPTTTPAVPTTRRTTTQPVAATTQPINASATPWQLQSVVTFQTGDVFKELVLTLDPDTLAYDGAILVSCCAPDDSNTNSKYINTSDAMIFYADVAAPIAINWTTATDYNDRFTETTLRNPAYVNIAPCPCDLTTGHCDTDCCCDEDCNDADVLVFNCTDSAADTTTIYDCASTDLYKADYWPLMCVQTSNSPYLGMYQSDVAAIRSSDDFNSAKTDASSSRDTSYQDSGNRVLEYTSPDTSAYSNGDPVELLYNDIARGVLALPQMTLTGECLWTASVQFQDDMSTRCNLPPAERLCQKYSPLNALMFLRPSAEAYPPCPDQPNVANKYGQSSISPTEVEYYCLEDVSEYLKEETNEEDLVDLYKSSLFAEYQNTSSDLTVPVRCAWDDGFTQPPIPSFDNDTGLCHNSTLNVAYEMFWRGGEIVQVKGSVVLGTLPLMQDGTFDIDDLDGFVSPPPMTQAPPTEAPITSPVLTTEPDLTTFATDGITLITDVTEVLQTAFTDLFTFPNSTDFINFADANSTGATDNITSPIAATTPVAAITTQAGISSSPAATTSFMSSPPPTTPVAAITTQAGISSPPAATTLFMSSPPPTTPAAILTSLAPGATTSATTSNLTVTPATNETTDNTSAMPNTTTAIANATTNMSTTGPSLPPTTPIPYTPINTEPLNITLLFSTTFTYLPESTVDPITGQTIDPPAPEPRSGNPGYVIGKPLLTGIEVLAPLTYPTTPGPAVNCTLFPSSPSCVEIPLNETVFVFDRVDVSESSQLKIFYPGDGSLCAHSSTDTLTFGEDVMSGCILRMGQSELQNCSMLALYMQEQLRALVPSDRVGKRGNSSVDLEEDWAQIFNPDEHPYVPATTMPPTTVPGTTDAPLTTRYPGQTYVDVEPPVDAVEQLMYTCDDIPTSVNLEVLITEAGLNQGFPLYEVLAASVTYTTSTVKLSCSGGQGASCYLPGTPLVANGSLDGATMVQSFPVYSSVTYTTVPAQEPDPVILYYKDYDPNLCKQEACWAELLYPMTKAYDGDPFTYSLGVGLWLILSTTVYFIITWPCARS